MENVSTLPANGRQIKNAVRSATLLAARQHARIRFKQITIVLRPTVQVTSE